MPPQESPAQVARLRTALAIGRQQRSQWPTHAKKLAAAREQHSACSHPPVLDLGVITAPSNGMRRRRIRQARDLLLADDARCSVVITFLLGSLNMFSAAERKLVAAEREQHNDLLLLRAHDGALASAASHGGRAVAEKALAWFIHSANHSRAHFVAKVDDDSMVSLPRLVSELRAVMATAPRPESAHFGVHLYRLWDWQKFAPGAPARGPRCHSASPHSRKYRESLSGQEMAVQNDQCGHRLGAPAPGSICEARSVAGAPGTVFGCAWNSFARR